MATRIDSLNPAVILNTGWFLNINEYDVDGYRVSLGNFLRNLNTIRSTGANLSISANQEANAITINQTSRRVGIGSFYGTQAGHTALIPLYDFEVAGTSGNDATFGFRGTGVNQDLIFQHNAASYRFRKDTSNDFILSGAAATHPYMRIPSGSGILFTDGEAYDAASLDSDVDMQFHARDKIRLSVNDQTNELDMDFTYSGIQSNGDFYIDYLSGANAVSGSFFGLGGAVFVSNITENTRIGNYDIYPNARLHISNVATNGTSYKTCILEDEVYPNLYFQKTGSSLDASITFNATNSLHFARNKATATVSNSDPFIFNLSSRKIGVGGINPVYTVDVTGGLSTVHRIASTSEDMIIKYQSDYPSSSGPVNSIFTTYSSGTTNKFLVGHDFQNEYQFFQTGDTDNTYYTGRNTHMFKTNGDLDIKGSYTTREAYCRGKFIQNFHTRCVSADIYVNPFNESSHTAANTSSSTENPFAIAPYSGKIEKIKILSADQDLSDFSAGARFEISVVNAASGTDETLNCFSGVANSAPTSLPDNGVVAQFNLVTASSPGTVYSFTNFSGDASFNEGQLVQYRICQSDGSATDVNATIMSSVSFTVI